MKFLAKRFKNIISMWKIYQLDKVNSLDPVAKSAKIILSENPNSIIPNNRKLTLCSTPVVAFANYFKYLGTIEISKNTES